jgi:hypothetical protein
MFGEFSFSATADSVVGFALVLAMLAASLA